MNPAPQWLPPMICVDPWGDGTFNLLYEVFCRDFIQSRPRLNGAEVWFFMDKENNKELIFWHLTEREDKRTRERFPDPQRSARLPWVRAIINNAGQQEVTAWDYIESDKSIGTYLWLREQDFVVVLRKYPNGKRRLITAYFVDFESKRRSFESKLAKKM